MARLVWCRLFARRTRSRRHLETRVLLPEDAAVRAADGVPVKVDGVKVGDAGVRAVDAAPAKADGDPVKVDGVKAVAVPAKAGAARARAEEVPEKADGVKVDVVPARVANRLVIPRSKVPNVPSA